MTTARLPALLGASLLAMGLCTNEQIARALAEQLSLSVDG